MLVWYNFKWDNKKSWPSVVAPDRALSMGQIELNCILMLNWIVWNRTVLGIETVLGKTELFKIELFWYLTVCKRKLYLYLNKLFELEQFD